MKLGVGTPIALCQDNSAILTIDNVRQTNLGLRQNRKRDKLGLGVA